MNSSFEQTLVDVWRQALVENAGVVELDGKRYPVRITPRKGLRQVDFMFDGNEIRGLEQNPDTKSRWAQFGTQRQQGDAISEPGTLRGGCDGRESDAVWQMKRDD